MRTLRHLPLIAFVLFLSGCVLSREPFYTADTVVEFPGPEGRWQLLGKDGLPEDGEFWTFEDGKAFAWDQRGQWRSIKLAYFRVDGVDFVDTIAEGPGDDIPSSEGYRSLHLVPFHMLSRIERTGDRIILRPLLTKEFRAVAGENPVASWIEQTDYETFVFNASPPDWVEFIRQHGSDGGLFSDESKLVFVRQSQ